MERNMKIIKLSEAGRGPTWDLSRMLQFLQYHNSRNHGYLSYCNTGGRECKEVASQATKQLADMAIKEDQIDVQRSSKSQACS